LLGEGMLGDDLSFTGFQGRLFPDDYTELV